MTTDLCFLPAVELAKRLCKKEISAREVFSAHLTQIDRVNPKVNAIVTLVAELALAEADRPDAAIVPGEIAGEKMLTYIDWMKSCYYISTVGHPAISVPGGFSSSGLPVGVQIVVRHQDDWGALQLAHAFEQATGFWKHHPVIAL